jgi:hypothetical protein
MIKKKLLAKKVWRKKIGAFDAKHRLIMQNLVHNIVI